MKRFCTNIQGIRLNRCGSMRLISDYLLTKHLQNHLYMNKINKTKQQQTMHEYMQSHHQWVNTSQCKINIGPTQLTRLKMRRQRYFFFLEYHDANEENLEYNWTTTEYDNIRNETSLLLFCKYNVNFIYLL